MCKAFLVEAKWFASGNLPSAEEYLKNGIVSSGVHIVMVHAFFLLGHGLTEENIKIIDRNPDIISSPATILRLWDDLGNAEVKRFYVYICFPLHFFIFIFIFISSLLTSFYFFLSFFFSLPSFTPNLESRLTTIFVFCINTICYLPQIYNCLYIIILI